VGIQGMTEYFEIELTDENGLIKGICKDDITNELAILPASIEGTFENGLFYFIKTYQYAIVFDEYGQSVAIPDKPSSAIHYKARLRKRLFSKSYFFKGAWEISGSYLDANKAPFHYSFSGTWKMKKLK
jgi:hypothetical protein